MGTPLQVSETVTGAFSGKYGETYTVTDTRIYKDYGSSEKSAWTFISKELTFETPSQIKVFYKLAVDLPTGTATKYYSLDSGTTWKLLTGEDIKDGDEFERAATIKLKIVGDLNAVVHSLVLIYRRMIGLR